MNKVKKYLRYNYIEVLIILFAFVMYLIFAIGQPFNYGPDEFMRYDIPQYIFEHGTLPHGGDPEIRAFNWGTSYAFTPILSYMVSAAFMKVTSLFTEDSFALLISARMVNVMWGTMTAVVITMIGHKLFKDKSGLRYMFITISVLLPQYMFINSYVNNDALAIFSSSLIIYSWILGLETKWNKKSLIYLSIGLSLCFLSYYNAYGYILCSIVLFFASYFFSKGEKIQYKDMTKKFLIVFIIVFILAGWWFIRNGILYDGDILGMKTCDEYGEIYAVENLKPSLKITPYNSGHSLWYMLFDMNWIGTTFYSFIGIFGYMSVLINPHIYESYRAIFAVGLVGFVLSLLRLFPISKKSDTLEIKNNNINKLLFNITMVIALIIPNALNIYYSYFSDFQPQGRYSLAMLIPLMYFVSIGIYRILYIFSFMCKKTILKNQKIKKFSEKIKIKTILYNAVYYGIIILAVGCAGVSYMNLIDSVKLM